MDKRVIWGAGAILALLVVMKTPLIFTLFAFFILGMIPGTSLVIPAWVLLVVNPLLCIGVIWIVKSHYLLTPVSVPAPKSTRAKRAPRKAAARTKKTAVAAKRHSSSATA